MLKYILYNDNHKFFFIIRNYWPLGQRCFLLEQPSRPRSVNEQMDPVFIDCSQNFAPSSSSTFQTPDVVIIDKGKDSLMTLSSSV
jgi:hypothetical protein